MRPGRSTVRIQVRLAVAGSLAVGLALFAGCGTVPVQEPLILAITNRSHVEIHSVQHKPCGSRDSELIEVPIEEIEPGQTVRVYLPEECIDLLVLDEKGRVAGVQRDLRMMHDATWTIR